MMRPCVLVQATQHAGRVGDVTPAPDPAIVNGSTTTVRPRCSGRCRVRSIDTARITGTARAVRTRVSAANERGDGATACISGAGRRSFLCHRAGWRLCAVRAVPWSGVLRWDR
jgi:hypothetical protein